MTGNAEPRTRREEGSDRVEGFLRRFFGEGNDAGQFGETIRPFLDSLRRGDDAPVVLPRYSARTDSFSMYVIATSPAHSTQVGELITAFAGPTYSTGGDTVPAALDPRDPVDAAVIDFAWPGTTFVIRTSSNRQHRANLRKALELMQSTVARRPARSWDVIRPLGRLISEFEAALAAGGEASSRSALEQIAARGGITATNLAHLRIKRLDRLGLSRELLALDGLVNVLRQDPPLPVKEAVLNALHTTVVEEPLSRCDVHEACDRLRDVELPLPTGGNARFFGNEAVTVLLTAAVGRRDIPALDGMLSTLRRDGRVDVVPDVLWQEASALVAPSSPPLLPSPRKAVSSDVESEASLGDSVRPPATDEPPEAVSAAEESRAPKSWTELFSGVALGLPEAVSAVEDEAWKSWPSPDESDEALAQTLARLDDLSWNRAWDVVGAVIDALGYGNPAPRTVREFITYALTFDKLSTGDLVTVHALTEIFLRSAPSVGAYRSLLDELRDSCGQWVSPENAVTALDFADRLVLAACPDDSARLSLAVALLEPLYRYQRRLEDSVLSFARQLSGELGVPLEWVREEHPEEGNPLDGLSGRSILLYSLDEAVLARTSAELERRIPGLKVAISHDKVGNATLKKKAQNADVVALATRCAKHAGTGFIAENAKSAEITYADGSGSASLLRAAMRGLLAGRTES